MSHYPVTFGQLIVQARQHMDFSQEAFAQEFSLNHMPLDAATLNEIEQDRTDPRMISGLIHALSQFCDVPEKELAEAARHFEMAKLRQQAQDRQLASSLAAFRRSSP